MELFRIDEVCRLQNHGYIKLLFFYPAYTLLQKCKCSPIENLHEVRDDRKTSVGQNRELDIFFINKKDAHNISSFYI